MRHVCQELGLRSVGRLGLLSSARVLLDTFSEVVHHLVDLGLETVHLSRRFDCDESSKITIGGSGRDLGEGSHLGCQVGSHGVDIEAAGKVSVRYVCQKRGTDVISCHVPSIFSTSACTPNLPSVPTSLATRVTSAAKIASWSIILLIVLTKSRISPDTLTPTTFCVRSPRATAVYASISCRPSVSSAVTHCSVCNSSHLLRQIGSHDVHTIRQVLI